ncbi:MAG: hypothetical protein ACXWFC_14005 [Nitrososphaeraceae archaeon]
MSRTEWVLYYIPIIAAIVGFYLAMSPQFENDYNVFLSFIGLAIIFFVAPIVVELFNKFLSSKSVVKKFKNSGIEDGKIQYFKSRRDLDLRKFLGIAEKEIIFLSVTNEFIVTDYLELIKEYLINKEINVIFLILYPYSRHLNEMSKYFSIDEISLREKIEKTTRDLLNFRSSLKQNYRHLLHIQTYDSI